MEDIKWIDYVKEIQAIAQAGLTYTDNGYELERYARLRELSVEMMSYYSNTEPMVVSNLFANEKGYQTPKVDVRAVVFSENKILMVRETIDGRWSIPGGYADIGYSPGQVAVKEAYEESGYRVTPVKLLAVLDKQFHKHPASPHHLYKIFILCNIIGYEEIHSIETSDVGFFGENELPVLSTGRITEEQIQLLFEYNANPKKEAIFD